MTIPEQLKSLVARARDSWACSQAKRAQVRAHPDCAVCGMRRIWLRRCEAHHIEPVHVNPARAADPANFITLCRAHHFEDGHFCDWQAWNPHVVQLAAERRAYARKRREKQRGGDDGILTG